jgi:hypothetical protein
MARIAFRNSPKQTQLLPVGRSHAAVTTLKLESQLYAVSCCRIRTCILANRILWRLVYFATLSVSQATQCRMVVRLVSNELQIATAAYFVTAIFAVLKQQWKSKFVKCTRFSNVFFAISGPSFLLII